MNELLKNCKLICVALKPKFLSLKLKMLIVTPDGKHDLATKVQWQMAICAFLVLFKKYNFANLFVIPEPINRDDPYAV